ncbi:DsbA family protein [Gloeobacter kilaueensis]|uniref:DSBA oxidoreductase n=1 Tax=Gloeobacter kilaueensis (strain ATCC BAA-2537 / CCAP 1431/1 / ULC 316 / JS1) TaxID=1183438 RepID=U5QPV7_GLOK1|nr:thioredoxin domain-containing protein [Gloeobacter kilaueensis]AGY59664.1 DSBA oxidoreductase [Gloeobacter kilaueensis JS1]
MEPQPPPQHALRPVTADEHILGNLDATVLLVKYGDFECPNSQRLHFALIELRERLQERLTIVFRHFPQGNLHPHAHKAAEAAEAAAAQGHFWPMHALLFAHQDALSNGFLVEYALQVGLDIPRFLQEVSGGVHRERVEADRQSGQAAGVEVAPALFIDQVRYRGGWSTPELLAAIESERR